MIEVLFEERTVLLKTGSRTYMIIADLHIGFELDLKNKGIRLPLQTDKIVTKLLGLLNKYNVYGVVILGDLKHSLLGYNRREAEDVRWLVEQIYQFANEVVLIPGNHDSNIEEILHGLGVRICSSRGIRVKNSELSVGLFHGHAWPSLRVLSCEILIMGHIHPTVGLRDSMGLRYIEPVWVRVRVGKDDLAYSVCKHLGIDPGDDPLVSLKMAQGVSLGTKWILIMPAFNPFLSGLMVNEITKVVRMSPILSAVSEHIEHSEVYLCNGTYLGSPRLLHTLYGI